MSFCLENFEKLFRFVASGQKVRYFTDQNGPNGGGGHMKMNLCLFSNSGISVTDSLSEKSRLKKWGHLSNFHVPFSSYGP